MTKQRFFNTDLAFGLERDKDEGQRSVHGKPSNFYLYDQSRNPPWSKWIKGQSGDFYSLRNTIDDKHRVEFIKLFNELFKAKS